jgi:hypothetical protein
MSLSVTPHGVRTVVRVFTARERASMKGKTDCGARAAVVA